MLERFRIGTRLAFGFGGLIVAAAFTLGSAIWIGVGAQRATADAAAAATARLETAYAMERAQLQLVSAVRNAGLQTSSAKVNEDIAVYRSGLKLLMAAEESLGATALDAEDQRLYASVVGLRKQAEPLADEAMRFTLAMAGEEAAKVLSGPFASLQTRWASELALLTQRARESAARAQADIAAGIRRKWTFLGIAMVVATLAAAMFAVALTRSVTLPLRRASEVAQRVANGDLSVRIDSDGRDEAAELLHALQLMAQQLAAMVNAVRDSSESINVASREISSGNLEFVSRTESQAVSVQRTATTLSALLEAVERYSVQASQIRQIADDTAQLADASGETMNRVAETMAGISHSSQRIEVIIGVIDGIAFQTNILALNAAVEAARAGDNGRGFAVVASEVRALAQRVSSAAAEVRGLIGESVQRVEGGTQLVQGMSDTLQRLVGSVSTVKGLVGQMSEASASQAGQLREVDGTLHTIESASQQNAALVEQLSGAAWNLSSQTQLLSEVVRRFRVDCEAT